MRNVVLLISIPKKPKFLVVLLYIGLPITEGNVRTVIQMSRISECKSWLKTLKCFRFAEVGIGDLSPTHKSHKSQFLSQKWLKTEQNCQWWRLGMKLIRCNRGAEVETIHELMEHVANYNYSGKRVNL